MELSDRENDLSQAFIGTAKAVLSLIPGLGPAIAGWDSYRRSNFERNLRKIISTLQDRIENVESFFSDEWLKTDEGKQFSRKVLNCAFDTQIEDKQELFVNALISGVKDKQTVYLEKLKFVDILRHLSYASLMVLAEMHEMFIGKVRGPGRSIDPVASWPQIDAEKIAQQLGDKFHPYLTISAISEMQSQGLFSRIGAWKAEPGGSYVPGGGFASALCYTDFTARFVEFILNQTRSGNSTSNVTTSPQ